MSVGTQSVASMEQRWRLGPPALIAVASVFIAVLFVTEPFAIAACMFVGLLLAAALHFDLFVYATIFLLPWYPLLNLRFQDAFLPLRFVLFVGVWIQLRRNNKSIREWLLGSKWKKGIWLFAGIAVVSVPLSSTPSNLPAYRSLALLASYFAVFYAIDGWMIDRTRLVRVLKVLLISTIGVALFGLYQAIDGSYTGLYFGLYPIQNENLEPWSGRITSFLFQYNSLAGYLNLVIPLAIACAVLAKDRMLKFLGLVCAFTAAVAVLLTQSRGGLLALAGLFIIAVWLLVPRVTTRIKLVCVVALAGLLLIPPLLNHFDRLENVDICSSRCVASGCHDVYGSSLTRCGIRQLQIPVCRLCSRRRARKIRRSQYLFSASCRDGSRWLSELFRSFGSFLRARAKGNSQGRSVHPHYCFRRLWCD